MESSPRAGPRLAEHVAVPGEERPGRALAPSVWRAGCTLSTRSPIFLTNARGGVTSAVHRLTVKPKGLWRLGRLDDSRGAGWRGGTVTIPFSNPQVFPLRCATSPVVTKSTGTHTCAAACHAGCSHAPPTPRRAASPRRLSVPTYCSSRNEVPKSSVSHKKVPGEARKAGAAYLPEERRGSRHSLQRLR